MSTDAGGTPTTTELGAAERAELERLRAELEHLRAETAAARRSGAGGGTAVLPAPHRTRRWPRLVAAGLLITLGCLLAPLSVVAVWAESEVSDVDRYVETVAPLAEDPAVQAAVSARITDAIFERVDIEGLTDDTVTALSDTLPPALASRLALLSGTIANGVQSAVSTEVDRVVASDAFANAWAEANRAVHEQLVATLSGDTSTALQVSGDTVTVDLATFTENVKQRLVDRGFGLAAQIPEIDADLTILQSEDIPRIQRAFDVLGTLGVWMPIVTIGLLAAGVLMATNRWAALVAAGLGVAAAMLVTGAALAVGRQLYLDAVPPDVLPLDAATAIFDAVVVFLRQAIRALGLAALLVALGGFLAGRSPAAVRFRGTMARAGTWASRGLDRLGVPTARVAATVAPLGRGLRIGLVLVAVLVVLIPAYPTWQLVAWTAVGLAAALFVLQVLSSTTQPARVA